MTPGLYVLTGDPMDLWPPGIKDWKGSDHLMTLHAGEVVVVLSSCPLTDPESCRTPDNVVQVIHGSSRGTLFTTQFHTLRRVEL